MLPLSLLKIAQDSQILIELKNGDTYNGRLSNCNMFMNMTLSEVICTSRDGEKFWKMPEVFIRGNSIKYIRIPDEILEQANQIEHQQRQERSAMRGGRDGRGGRGRGGRGGRGEGRGRGRGGGGRGEGRGGP
jgi:U6 snRNA-associated Sm-like protein LSm4